MRTKWTFGERKTLGQRLIGALIDYAFGAEIREIQSRQDALSRLWEANLTQNARFEKDQARLREVHSDWIAECERQQTRHETFIAEMKAQNDIFERALLFARNHV